MQRPKLRSLSVALALAWAPGCDRSRSGSASVATAEDRPKADQGQPSAPPPNGAEQVTPTPPRAEPSLQDALTAIPDDTDDVLTPAAQAFLARYPGGDGDETAQKADIERVVARMESRLSQTDTALQADDDRSAAACEATGKCGSGTPTKQAVAWIESLPKLGITIVYAGEGTVEAAVDYRTLAECLAPALTKSGAAYLEALALAQRASSHYDEGGYGGPPSDLVDALIAWETLAALGPSPYAKEAESRAGGTVDNYLAMADSELGGQPRLTITKAMQKSYAAFGKDHPDSKYAPLVARFLALMRAKKFRPTREQLQAASAEVSRAR